MGHCDIYTEVMMGLEKKVKEKSLNFALTCI